MHVLKQTKNLRCRLPTQSYQKILQRKTWLKYKEFIFFYPKNPSKKEQNEMNKWNWIKLKQIFSQQEGKSKNEET